jgi:hypothetical protein
MKKARVRVQSVDNSVIVKFLSQMYMRKLVSQAGGGSGAALPPALQARVQKVDNNGSYKIVGTPKM